MTDISIIIACRNGAATLADALDSLVAQRCDRPWEIVLADNGSTDDSRAVFERHAAAHPEVAMRVIEVTDRASKAHALNVAIRAVASPWLVFCDADDTVAPGWLAAMARALETEPFVACRLDTRTLNPDWARIGRARREIGISRITHAPFCTVAGGATLGFHRRVFEAAGGFDPGFRALEDIDFCIRAHLAGFTLADVPDAVYRYRFRATPEGIRRQARAYARHRALLRARYGEREPFLAPGPWLALARRLGHVVAWRLWQFGRGRALDDGQRTWFNSEYGKVTGILAGSLAYRVPPPHRPASVDVDVAVDMDGPAVATAAPGASRGRPRRGSPAERRPAPERAPDRAPDRAQDRVPAPGSPGAAMGGR